MILKQLKYIRTVKGRNTSGGKTVDMDKVFMVLYTRNIPVEKTEDKKHPRTLRVEYSNGDNIGLVYKKTSFSN